MGHYLAAHAPQSGHITLHPGPGTTSDTTLASDLLQALGKPARLPAAFRTAARRCGRRPPSGRPPWPSPA
ncbi:hypothetical protein ABT224_41170 [Streptomyces sp. NPDC001584]|uniref:hypothetical protein n=1 Tax=Streptomyces sp. NPDC001584 TaxID=3154521 RepID=UPI003317A9A8